jgi:hypothetical protein
VNSLTAVKAGRLVEINSLIYTLVGIYTNGITALSDSGQILFLTANCVRGPFTVFAPGLQNYFDRFQKGQEVITDQKSIRIPETDLLITSDSMEIWPAYENPLVGNVSRIRFSSLKVINDSWKAGICKIDSVWALKAYLDQCQCIKLFGGTKKAFSICFAAIHHAFSDENYFDMIEAATGMIGLGEGLTPAGDDFLAGFIVALSFVRDQIGISKNIYHKISDEIILRAKKETNPISAALLSAAQKNEINEPLFTVIQYLVCGNSVPLDVIQNLSSVGHTSGFDSLTGCLFVFCVLLGEFEHLYSKQSEVESGVKIKKEYFQ